jgi:phosphoglycerate dehydrogenase-like enzyme
VPQDITEIATEHFRSVLADEIEATFFLLRAALPQMRERRWGRFVSIGGEVARLAQAFGMRVIGARRSAKKTRYVDQQVPPERLGELLAASDFVVLACPLTKETEGLIDERELRAMKPTATLINIARGKVVREAALVRALKQGWIAGACLDVFEREPLPEDSELWSLPNVVVTPHNSGFSPLQMQRQMAIFIDNLGRLVAGRPLRNRVLRAGGA